MDAERFGAFIQARRKELGLKQSELAERIHVTDKAISRWERGVGFPDIKLLEPLADALEVSILELMQSERIVNNDIPTENAEKIISGTLDIACAQHRSLYGHPVYWISYLGICALMAFFIGVFCYYVDALWIRAIAVYLAIVCGSLGMSAVSTLLRRSINPDAPVKSQSKPYYLFRAMTFLGGLALILSFPAKDIINQGVSDAMRMVGFVLMISGSAYDLYKGKLK